MAYIGEMQYLTIGNNTYSLPTGGGGGGTVTSVGVANATNGGLSVSGSPITTTGTISIGHSNVLSSAQTTQAVYPIKIDKNGHISSYGSAVTIPTKVSQLTNDSNYVTTDEKVKQTPLNAVNGYRQMIVTTSSLSSETTSTTAFTKNLTYNDYTPTLKIEKNSDSTKYISITGEVIKVNNGSYATKIICDTPTTSDKTITFPNTTGTVALTSDIPTKTSDLTNDGDGTSAFATLADIGSFGGGTVTSVGVTNATNGGLSISGSPVTTSGTITIGHSNVLSSAQTTQAVYPIKIDKNGHISAYGSAVTIPTKTSDLTNDSGFITSYTDENLKWTASTSSNTYYPLQSTSTATTSTANTLNGISFYQYYNTAGGYRRLDLGNSTAYKSTGGAYGTIRLYGSAATYYGDLVPGVLGTTSGDGHISANRTWTLPDKTGTIALTSDIPTVPTITLNGSATTSPSFYAPTSAGTDGYVLKSNGSGAPTWTSATLTDTQVTSTAVTAATTNYLVGSTTSTTITGGLSKHASGVLYTTADSGTSGYTQLRLGNTTATTSAGGKEGQIRLYGTNATYYLDLKPGAIASSNKTITFPNKTGTVALTDDIPSVPTITLNGSSSTSPSFYAPTGAGTNGQYLKSNGSGAPSWTNFPTIPSITLNGSSTTSPSFYAPTSAGTSGYFLKSNGSGAPSWVTKPSYVASEIEVDQGTFNDYTVDVALDDIDYDIKNNYLPLSAGSTKPLSGDLYLPNNNIRFGNSKIIMGYTTGLDTDIYLNAFQACNENNNLVIGYGGYDNQIGSTNIYGDYIRIYTPHAITSTGYIEYTNKPVGYRIGGIYAKAARPSSNVTLTTSNQKISLATSVFGTNSWFTLENGGITVEQECYIRVYGYVYVTNLTAQDAIYVIAAKNGTGMINQYYRATSTTDSFVLMPGFIDCDAGDVITLVMRNSTAARGSVQASSFTQFIVEIAGLKS